ncbi:hypothetical protein [Pleurocapsa sp. FMAR1]|uniref:hypothetical protein n=1 Tax=Pleurocapsa sp. FMAR1 TaxID=3040204 RepID=UPI0029C5FBCF|nr:hypothetical protein [Pleurocapsa sp. FMAR1]
MKKIRHQDLQRQIVNLISIVEMYIPLIEEIDKSKNKLSALPTELDSLKQQLEFLKLQSSQTNFYDSQNSILPSPIKETDIKLDFLVDDLEGIFVYLTTFESKLKNIIVLKERLEAVQEERIGGFTPERIYRLLERKDQSSQHDNIPSHKNFRSQSLWQKIANYKYSKKLAIGTALISGTILLFSMVSYSSMNQQSINDNTTQEIKQQ